MLLDVPYSGKYDRCMFSFVPSLNDHVASQNLSRLIPPLAPAVFLTTKIASDIRKLDSIYHNYCRYASPPWVSSRLAISCEAIRQSELWLPMTIIGPVFVRFLHTTLSFSPIIKGTHLEPGCSSWLEFAATFPVWLESYANPAKLLNRLYADYDFRTKFILWFFMPKRYYGKGSDRYPLQMQFLKDWITQKKTDSATFRILDAAAGDGEAVYAYAGLLHNTGFSKDTYDIEGWALDPLESWSAAHLRFQANTLREADYRKKTSDLFKNGITDRIIFTHDNLLVPRNDCVEGEFEVVVCNGLLFGPLLHEDEQLKKALRCLSSKLKQGGLLLFADHFHDGWKKKFPAAHIDQILHESGLSPVSINEGSGAIKKGAP